MRPKLTKQIVNERIAHRGIIMIGEYVSALSKTTFKCSEGHEWTTTPNSVMSGKGCPHCSGNATLNKEIVNERIAHRGLMIVGDYESVMKKTTFKCSEGHEWTTTPNSVMSGKGCPHCAGLALLSKEIVNERIARRGIMMVGQYVNSATKTTFKCSEGHEWTTTPNHIMMGKGCPYCSTTASDNDVIYVWRSVGEYHSDGTPIYKVGITSAKLDKRRIYEVARKANREAEIIFYQQVVDARAIENKLLTLGTNPNYNGFDGATEFRAFSNQDIDFIKELLCQTE